MIHNAHGLYGVHRGCIHMHQKLFLLFANITRCFTKQNVGIKKKVMSEFMLLQKNMFRNCYLGFEESGGTLVETKQICKQNTNILGFEFLEATTVN